jgi:hypothetical protein
MIWAFGGSDTWTEDLGERIKIQTFKKHFILDLVGLSAFKLDWST